MNRWLALLLGGVLVFVGLSMLLVDVIPPRSLTATRMSVTKRRLLKYASAQKAMPASLSDLPPSPGHDDSLVDAWHRPILYTSDPSGVVTLTSLGQDGKPGGSGDDADIVRRFQSRKPDGTWSDELIDWLKPTTTQPSVNPS